jgi:hypothetical protein
MSADMVSRSSVVEEVVLVELEEFLVVVFLVEDEGLSADPSSVGKS